MKSNKRKIIIILSVVILAICLVIVGLVVIGKKDQKTDVQTTSGAYEYSPVEESEGKDNVEFGDDVENEGYIEETVNYWY